MPCLQFSVARRKCIGNHAAGAGRWGGGAMQKEKGTKTLLSLRSALNWPQLTHGKVFLQVAGRKDGDTGAFTSPSFIYSCAKELGNS